MNALDREPPLCVDLDGTLLRTDTLAEGAVRLLRRDPLAALRMAWWLLRGRAHLKSEIAARETLDPGALPVNETFVAWLREQAAQGRRLVLCTATAQSYAAAVAAHFGLFESVLSSDERVNLKGRTKAAALVARYGERGYDFAGNDMADLPALQSARRQVIVAPTPALQRRLAVLSNVERVFGSTRVTAGTWARALRMHQWLKNLLVFMPAAAAHHIMQRSTALASLQAFVIFGLCASGTYLLNDLTDLDADRRHPRKSARPLAAGQISLAAGLIAAAVLIAAALILAGMRLGELFLASMLFYTIVTLWYSHVLKRMPMVDTLALAGLYAVRVIGGAAATRIVPSFWLLAFTMFLFLSLALAKRYSEMKLMLASGRVSASGRGYTTEDAPLLQSCGVASGYISVLVLALYINSTAAQFLYARAEFLWLLCPLLLYWTSRVWLKTSRGQMHDDPVVFALSDVPSLTVAAISVVLVWAASNT